MHERQHMIQYRDADGIPHKVQIANFNISDEPYSNRMRAPLSMPDDPVLLDGMTVPTTVIFMRYDEQGLQEEVADVVNDDQENQQAKEPKVLQLVQSKEPSLFQRARETLLTRFRRSHRQEVVNP